jgi:hypothetical protein
MYSRHHPSMKTWPCPTQRLPSPNKSNPVLVVVARSRPPKPLRRKTQVNGNLLQLATEAIDFFCRTLFLLQGSHSHQL